MHLLSVCVLASLSLTILALVPAIARAQQPTLTGRVVDANSGQPVAGATVSIAGQPGAVKTDTDGRFAWPAAPTPPLQLIVVLPGGHVARPVDVLSFGADVVPISVNALADESVTVVGAAPSISVAPASATSLLSATQIARRTPENLM